MKTLLCLLCFVIALGLGGFGYTKVMARIKSGTPPAMAAPGAQADAIRVIKADRRLELLKGGTVIRSYPISMGANPVGHKAFEGDERTPEGQYVIDWRNQSSVAHLSLHISYPNSQDRQRARDQGVEPGGNIMIHGLPNGWGLVGRMHLLWNWTNGCIAVTNEEMDEIWSLVPNGTPIEIVPNSAPNETKAAL